MIVFDFEPGDGIVYMFVFGRTKGAKSSVNYTVFGLRDDKSKPLTVFPFEHEDIDIATFTHCLRTSEWRAETIHTAWRVYSALVGLPDAPLPHGTPKWPPDWRKHLQPGTW